MSERYSTNLPSRLDIFHNIWVSCLFIPIVMIYVHLILLLKDFLNIFQADPVIDFVFEFLGFGFLFLLARGVRMASIHSKNDFIAGPIEQLNLYTFFLLGLLLGGSRGALILTLLYEMVETVGWGGPEEFKSISDTEWAKAKKVGIPRKEFILKYYILAPITTIISLWIALMISSLIVPIDSYANMTLPNQIISLTICFSVWTFFDVIISSIYNKSFPSFGANGIISIIILFTPTYFLKIENIQWFTWPLYAIAIINGLDSIIGPIFQYNRILKESEETRDYYKRQTPDSVDQSKSEIKIAECQDLMVLGTKIALAFRNSVRSRTALKIYASYQGELVHLIGRIACDENEGVEKRILAIQVLGELRTERAVPYLARAIASTKGLNSSNSNDMIIASMYAAFKSESYPGHKLIRNIWKGGTLLSGTARLLDGGTSNLSWWMWSRNKCSYLRSIVYSDRGVVYYNRGQFPHALNMYIMAIHTYPYYGGYWKQMGDARVQMGLLEDGTVDLGVARALSPFLASDLAEIGQSFEAAGDQTGARMCYEQVQRLKLASDYE